MNLSRWNRAVAAMGKGLFINAAYFLSGFFPRDQRLWIFGAWGGTLYRDNARYLFEHALKDPARRGRVFWITHSPQIESELRKKGYPVMLSSLPKAWWLQLRAGVIFVTHGRHDVSKFLTRRATVVFLNHALPIKHMGYDAQALAYYHPNPLRKIFFMLTDPYWNIHFDYLLAPSRQTARIVCSSYRANEARILSLGFPRFQALATAPRRRTTAGLRKILYMPTFRDHEHFCHFERGFDLSKAERRLAALNAELLIALHPFDRSPIPKEIRAGLSQSLQLFKPGDVNEILRDMDLLVTDFSSVMFDYLLLDRPMIFTQFDFDDFLQNQRGTYFNYEEVTPGPKVGDWPQLLDALESSLNGGTDPWQERRTQVRARLFHPDYSHVNERILEHVEKLNC